MPLLPVCQFLWAQKRLERIRHAISATSQDIMESLTFEHLSIAPRLVIVAFSVVVRSSSRIRLPNLFFSTVQQSERASQWRSVILSMSSTCYSRVVTRQIHLREIVEVFKMWVKHSEQYDLELSHCKERRVLRTVF